MPVSFIFSIFFAALIPITVVTLEDLVKRGGTVPAGFSCWPGGSGAIIVPATGKGA